MKNKILFLFIILFYSCSFDNKSGIWKNENLISKDNNNKVANNILNKQG